MSGPATSPRTAIALRPARTDDASLLFTVFASTRDFELEVLRLPPAQAELFLRQQFHAQATQYALHYGDGDHSIIEVDGVAAGRLWVVRWEREIRVVDIAILPAHRGLGVGTRLLGDVIARGQSEGVPVTIHVEVHNPARRLYERLGFRLREDKGIYLLMERPVS